MLVIERVSRTNAAKELMLSADPLRLLETCEDEVRLRGWALMYLLSLHGFGLATVICGRRDLREQQRLYGMGRSAVQMRAVGAPEHLANPGAKKVTWVKPDDGRHVQGLAFDVNFSGYKLSPGGVIGKCADAVGLTWGGNWKVRDYGHFEL